MTSPAPPSFEALLARDDVIWMGQNTTHLPPAPEVLQALADSAARREFQLYAPPAGFAELRELIVEDLALPGFRAWVVDGAVAGLHHVCTTLAPRISRMITSDPGWPWPGRFVSIAGVPVTRLAVYDQPRALLSAEQIARVVEPNSVIYLIDPLNPLGGSYTATELADIVEVARSTDSYLIHDTTYRHFADSHTLAAPMYPEKTFTTYSFSKWLGLAGLRVGAVVAAPDLLDGLMAVPPNPLGAGIMGQRAAIAGLRIRDRWLAQLRETNRRNLDAVERTVAESGRGSVVVPRSQGNFLAIDITDTGWSADALCAEILDRTGVFIRPGTYQSPMFGERFVKVSTSVPAGWVDRFCAAWTSVPSR
ncbi:MAG: pyridoxal phosphate-dependent aminotransferase [Actinomycetota bacterium]|nr:pyridoxal phosphate-dependent aminotransferase [Actinomycetota bacterium]